MTNSKELEFGSKNLCHDLIPILQFLRTYENREKCQNSHRSGQILLNTNLQRYRNTECWG
jgi:hypothetical protein